MFVSPEAEVSVQPRYVVSGPYAGDPGIAREVAQCFDTMPFETTAPELDAPEYKKAHYAINDTIHWLAYDRGADVGPRLRDDSYLHLYTKGHFLQAAHDNGRQDRETPRSQRYKAGFSSTGGHTAVRREKNPMTTLLIMGHENLHSASYAEIDVRQIEDTWHLTVVRSGLSDEQTGKYTWLNEIMTSVGTMDLVRNYWPHHGNLLPYLGQRSPLRDFGYNPGLILFDGLLKASFDTPSRRRDVIHGLEAGTFNGDKQCLAPLEGALGETAMRKLTTLNPSNPYRAYNFARHLGMRELARNIKLHKTNGVLEDI